MQYQIDFWYDRSLKLWTCLWVDKNGYQYGSAQYARIRSEKDRLVERMLVTEPSDYQI